MSPTFHTLVSEGNFLDFDGFFCIHSIKLHSTESYGLIVELSWYRERYSILANMDSKASSYKLDELNTLILTLLTTCSSYNLLKAIQ